MEINEFFTKNDKLFPLMKRLILEIEQLERLRDLFRKDPERRDPRILQRLTRRINWSKKRVTFLNDAYDQGAAQNEKCDSAFMMEINEALEEIKICYQRSLTLKNYWSN
jgi:hypothetical protein